MGIYMMYVIDHHWFKPEYHCPRRDHVKEPICILPHCDVYCLYGIKMVNMLYGNGSISYMYSTMEYFDTVSPAVKESTPQSALKDMIWYMHLSDDWDDDRGVEFVL